MSSILRPGKVRAEVVDETGAAFGTVANPLVTQLSGSIIPDGESLPVDALTDDLEVAAYAYDRIIEEVGLENFVFLVPGWEREGLTIRDMFNPNLSFTLPSAPGNVSEGDFQMGAPGVLHANPFLTYNTGFLQDPFTRNNVGSADRPLAVGGALAQKLAPNVVPSVGFVRLMLKREGSLASATLKASIYDGASEPEGLLAESDLIDASTIGTDAALTGFAFSTPLNWHSGASRWLVLEYADASGVDGSNRVHWVADAAGAYAQPATTRTGGVWAARAGESQAFEAYTADAALPDDFTFIAAAWDARQSAQFRYPFRPLVDRKGNLMVQFGLTTNGDFRVRASIGGSWTPGTTADMRIRRPQQPAVWAMSFKRDATENKLKSYSNGRLIGTAHIGGDRPLDPLRHPWEFGVSWVGPVGPWMLIRGQLNDAQVARISSHLLTRRRLTQGGAL